MDRNEVHLNSSQLNSIIEGLAKQSLLPFCMVRDPSDAS